MDDPKLEELSILRSIYGGEVTVNETEPCTVSMQLFPSTADDESKKHVCLSVTFIIPSDYPDKKPKVEFTNVRGLSQELEADLIEKLYLLMESKLGSVMLFDSIDLVKEFLTENNHPSIECSICLELMDNENESSFIKTSCYHYFHPWCLAEYLKSGKELKPDENSNPEETTENKCPICRCDMDVTLEQLESYEKPNDDTPEGSLNDKVELGEEFKKFQEQMQQLLEKQREQGGTVDVSAPSNVVIDVSSASRKIESSHGADEKYDAGKKTKGGCDEVSRCTQNERKVAPTLSSPIGDPKPSVLASTRGGARNLNSSYPVHSFRRNSSRDSDIRSKHLSSSYNVGSTNPEPRGRIDHKYHDGRWRPRKKHDFEIRAELLEKSRSLDEQNLASEETPGTPTPEGSSSDLKPKRGSSDEVSSHGAQMQKDDESSNENMNVANKQMHSTLYQTSSNPVSNESSRSGKSFEPRTDPMVQPRTRRVKTKPPLSVSTKPSSYQGGGPKLSSTYSEGDYYSYGGYDNRNRSSDAWYYGGGGANENYYPLNSSGNIYRNRHSYHGNNKRGTTGYQGNRRGGAPNSAHYYNDQMQYFEASASYDWEFQHHQQQNHWHSYSAQPSPKVSPRGAHTSLKSRQLSCGERESYEDIPSDSPHPFATPASAGPFSAYMITPNSPMLQPMPVLPAPTSGPGDPKGKGEAADSVFSYYNGPAAHPPRFAYPLY